MSRLYSAVLMVVVCVGCDGTHLTSQPDADDSVVIGRGVLDGGALPMLAGNGLPLDGGVPQMLGWLVFDVRDDATDVLLPARVAFRPPPGAGYADDILQGTYSPSSPGAADGAVVGPGVLGSAEGVMLAFGQGAVPVPAGHYQLFVHHGPAYEGATVDLDVAPGAILSVQVELRRSVDTSGWLAADLHVHTLNSFDSTFPLERRAISMVTNGVELIVTTDHNRITDLGPTLAALGYDRGLAGSFPGDEFNFSQGHGGAYPLRFDAGDALGGAPPYQTPGRGGGCDAPIIGINCVDPSAAFDFMHSLASDAFVTINHGIWPEGDLGYFTNIGWGAGTPARFAATPPALDHFDGIELLNGYQVNARVVSQLGIDWFWMLGTGHRITALGSSDTHSANWVSAGWPRTYLRFPVDNPAEVTPQMFADALRHGRAIATTGPFIRLQVNGGDIGDTVEARRGRLRIESTVDAPTWMRLDTAVVYINGIERHRYALAGQQRPLVDIAINERCASDCWVVVAAWGNGPMPSDVVGEYGRINRTRMMPFAITNPVFVDVDGDGQVTPPPTPDHKLDWFEPAASSAGPSPHHEHHLTQPIDTEPPLNP